MKPEKKRKVNLTIQPHIFEMAQRVAEQRGRSLSALVEEFLARLALEAQDDTGDWLSKFHSTYLPPTYTDPSDDDIVKLRLKATQRHL